jgi:hypothetical protein
MVWRPACREDQSDPFSMRHTEVSNLYEEKHYTPGQIAKSWSLNEDSIRRLFKNEPGVLEIPRPETRHKRAYTTLRVPESVLRRVHARLTKKAVT